MPKNSDNIIRLADGAKKGNSQAIDKLVTIYHQDIYKMVFYRTGSQMDAEDITQEIFIKMVKSIKNIRNTSLFKAWLYRIAVNKITDHYRKKAVLSIFVNRPVTEEESSCLNEDQSGFLMKKEFYASLFDFTKMLSKREKEIFLLRFIDQLSIKEIAETLHKSESTVKTHLYRSIKKFKSNTEFRNLLGGDHEN